MLAPFVSWLGPTMEAIRLPSALIGTATVPLLYGLVRNFYGRFAAQRRRSSWRRRPSTSASAGWR
ncbi:MAG: hypothetical protein R2849_07525 [Thermomicrobiales bacterium]